jgi:hypothetical protein
MKTEVYATPSDNNVPTRLVFQVSNDDIIDHGGIRAMVIKDN